MVATIDRLPSIVARDCRAWVAEHCAVDPLRAGRVGRDGVPRWPVDAEATRRAPADVELRDPGDIALVSAQRSLAYLQLLDVDEAERQAAKAAEAMPGSTVAESVAVNVVIQRARLNQLKERNQNAVPCDTRAARR